MKLIKVIKIKWIAKSWLYYWKYWELQEKENDYFFIEYRINKNDNTFTVKFTVKEEHLEHIKESEEWIDNQEILDYLMNSIAENISRWDLDFVKAFNFV